MDWPEIESVNLRHDEDRLKRKSTGKKRLSVVDHFRREHPCMSVLAVVSGEKFPAPLKFLKKITALPIPAIDV